MHKSTAIDPPPSTPTRPSPTLAPMTAALAPQRRFPRSPVGRTDGRKDGGRDGRAERGGRAARWGGMTALRRAVTSRGGTRRRCCGQRRRRPRTASTPSCSGGGRAGEPRRTDNTAKVFDFDTHRSREEEGGRVGIGGLDCAACYLS